jgi:acetylglutamate kinase
VNDETSAVVQLLGSLSSPREVRAYLEHYASLDSPRFGVVRVGGRAIAQHPGEVADALAFLHRVRLHPVLVHGGGLARPDEAEARRAIHDLNNSLVNALRARGVHTRPITSGVIEAEPMGVRTRALESSVRAGDLPVIAPLGETSDGRMVRLPADEVTRAVAGALRAHKVVFLTARGGLVDEAGRAVEAINLAEDEARLWEAPWVEGKLRSRLKEIKALLTELPPASSVSITDPAHLARELFTHRGAGTLIRLGERITRHRSFDEVDRGAVQAILERCFGRALAPGYFEETTPTSVYLADSHRAVAVVTHLEGVPYLDKLAVTAEAQGIGVAGSLWSRLVEDHPRLFWRSRANNPINGWYFGKASGAMRAGEWVVFWTGLDDFAEIERVVARARSLPPTLVAHGVEEEER